MSALNQHLITQSYKISYMEHGIGTPIVLLHSSMSSSAQWNSLIESLSSHYHVISIDLFGYGQTAMPCNDETFSLQDEIHLIETVLEHLQIPPNQPMHFIGHSYGGATALKLCHQSSRPILSLTVFEPVCFYLLPAQSSAFTEIQHIIETLNTKLEEGDDRKATEIFINYWNGPDAFQSLSQRKQQSFISNIKKVALDFQALLNEPTTLDDLQHLPVKTCLLAGSQSPLSTTTIIGLLGQSLPYNTTYYIDGGHMAPIFQAETVNSLIIPFIKKNDKYT